MNWQQEFIDLGVKYGSRIIAAVVILLIGKWAINLCLKLLDNWLDKKLDKTLHSFVKSITKALLYLTLLITTASTLGIEMTSFIAILGAAGLAVGLALQGSLSNLAGGVLILAFRPFNVGDFIETSNYMGKVKDIKILYTTLNTKDNKTVIIPNSDLSNNSLINYSAESTRRVELVIGVGYDDDIYKVKEVLEQIVKQHELILKEPEPIIRMAEHAASSINFNVFVWTETANFFTVKSDLLEEIKLRFDEEGINIPYPQMDVHLQQ